MHKIAASFCRETSGGCEVANTNIAESVERRCSTSCILHLASVCVWWQQTAADRGGGRGCGWEQCGGSTPGAGAVFSIFSPPAPPPWRHHDKPHLGTSSIIYIDILYTVQWGHCHLNKLFFVTTHRVEDVLLRERKKCCVEVIFGPGCYKHI